MILALDLSTACTGWALYNTDGALIDFGRIIPNDKDHNFLKIKFIVEKLKVLFKDSHQLIVEGIFLNTFIALPKLRFDSSINCVLVPNL